MQDIVVIGGGLSGLVNAIELNRAGHSVTLFERKSYPFHRVCGEYISNEVIPYLEKSGLFPAEFSPAKLEKFKLTSTNGKSFEMPLDLGGFGISRYVYDAWLVEKAREEGVQVREDSLVEGISFSDDRFEIKVRGKESLSAKVVIGAFGKRSKLDKSFKRDFTQEKSPYVGVKYHVKTDLVPHDHVELHNFYGGYCGVSQVEDEKYNLCYLSHRSNLKELGSIEEMEKTVLYKNPALKQIFQNSEFLFEKPEVINEISFAPKEPVFNHILMSGDAAGMITPLCGNGMAMAIHAAKICSDYVKEFLSGTHSRAELEANYAKAWTAKFGLRHWAGRKIQNLFGSDFASNLAVQIGSHSEKTARFLMKQTHGQPF